MTQYSRIKKDLKKNPGLWVIWRPAVIRHGIKFLISIGDPGLRTSRLVRTFTNPDDLHYYVKEQLLEDVSENQILDLSGERLVSPNYTQWYVDNIL